MWLQLFVLGLPIIPASVDRYLQAKFKQYIINPIVNFLYMVLVESFKWLCTALYLALWTIFATLYSIFQCEYTDLTRAICTFW